MSRRRSSSLQPLVPTALDEIVRRCLAKNPDERWQTADDVMRELKRVSESTQPGTPSTQETRGDGWPRSWSIAVTVLVRLAV